MLLPPVTRFIDANKLPHLLLYGPPGTGKTSTILACAKKMYGEKYKSMILEVRAGPPHTRRPLDGMDHLVACCPTPPTTVERQ